MGYTMKDSPKTNQELIAENSLLKKRIQELEQSEAERERVEETRREQLHFLQQLLDAIPIPIFFKDRQGIFRGCNRAYENLFGYDKRSGCREDRL